MPIQGRHPPHVSVQHPGLMASQRPPFVSLHAGGPVYFPPVHPSLGEVFRLLVSSLVSECPSCSFSVHPSDSWLSCSMTRHLFCLCGDFITSSHISVLSNGGVGQHDQSTHSGLSHSSKFDEYDLQLSESILSPAGWPWTSAGDGTLGTQPWGVGTGICCKPFADLSSTAVSDDDRPLIGTHSEVGGGVIGQHLAFPMVFLGFWEGKHVPCCHGQLPHHYFIQVLHNDCMHPI